MERWKRREKEDEEMGGMMMRVQGESRRRATTISLQGISAAKRFVKAPVLGVGGVDIGLTIDLAVNNPDVGDRGSVSCLSPVAVGGVSSLSCNVLPSNTRWIE